MTTPSRSILKGQPLTPRELDALAAYARIADRRIAASRLGIAENTLRDYLRQAYRKLGAHGALEAYRKLGWLTVPDGLGGRKP